jgi:hypothetical protein
MRDVIRIEISRTHFEQPDPTPEEIELLRQIIIQAFAPPLSDVTVTYSKEE